MLMVVEVAPKAPVETSEGDLEALNTGSDGKVCIVSTVTQGPSKLG